ncbi:uncharacterized protein ARMOST_13986 [Armillaria ostoyae]|uniref:Uncharacterized protein n=1 Tax=Armillaria ostoyae TaxID=47428 RepID=A0A284RPB5_ARMOS|nr:uncharacterized protein ARMOST_13986 [Armillaria ostoyae]
MAAGFTTAPEFEVPRLVEEDFGSSHPLEYLRASCIMVLGRLRLLSPCLLAYAKPFPPSQPDLELLFILHAGRVVSASVSLVTNIALEQGAEYGASMRKVAWIVKDMIRTSCTNYSFCKVSSCQDSKYVSTTRSLQCDIHSRGQHILAVLKTPSVKRRQNKGVKTEAEIETI